MKTIATCQNIQLLTKDEKYYIAETIEDDHLLHEVCQNEAMLTFFNCVRQVVYFDKKPTLNLKG